MVPFQGKLNPNKFHGNYENEKKKSRRNGFHYHLFETSRESSDARNLDQGRVTVAGERQEGRCKLGLENINRHGGCRVPALKMEASKVKSFNNAPNNDVVFI